MDLKEKQLGFIGLGAMGSRMCGRLVDAGFKVLVYSSNEATAKELTQRGAHVAASRDALAAEVDVLFSSLPKDDVVLDVFGGEQGLIAQPGLIEKMRKGAVLVETSTVHPRTARALAKMGAERGVKVVDAPVSGSTGPAEQGTLVFLVGGDAEVIEELQPAFAAMGRAAHRLGSNGAGATMKLVVNAILGTTMQAIAESVVMGEKAGLDRNTLLHVLADTAVIAAAHKGKLERAEKKDFSPQFPLKLMNKDFGLALELAQEHSAAMPATAIAHQIGNAEMARDAERDFSAVIETMERLAGLL